MYYISITYIVTLLAIFDRFIMIVEPMLLLGVIAKHTHLAMGALRSNKKISPLE